MNSIAMATDIGNRQENDVVTNVDRWDFVLICYSEKPVKINLIRSNIIKEFHPITFLFVQKR